MENIDPSLPLELEIEDDPFEKPLNQNVNNQESKDPVISLRKASNESIAEQSSQKLKLKQRLKKLKIVEDQQSDNEKQLDDHNQEQGHEKKISQPISTDLQNIDEDNDEAASLIHKIHGIQEQEQEQIIIKKQHKKEKKELKLGQPNVEISEEEKKRIEQQEIQRRRQLKERLEQIEEIFVEPGEFQKESSMKHSGKQILNNQSVGGGLHGNQFELFENYSCMLNLTDISFGVKGHNKFYQIQVVHQQQKTYYLFTKWGRVGAKNPQSQYQQFDSKYDAILAFKAQFSSQTFNEWDLRHRFRPQTGQYHMIDVENDPSKSQNQVTLNEEIDTLNKRNRILKSKMEQIQSTLPQQVADFMKMIWDINQINRSLKELNFDTEKNPLGKLRIEQINQGLQILAEIQQQLTNGTKESMLVELSNQFYTNIPQNYGMRKPPIIDNIARLKEKLNLVNALNQLDITNRYLNQAFQNRVCFRVFYSQCYFFSSQQVETVNPIDYLYDLMRIQLQIVESSNESFQMISRMVQETHGPTHDKYKIRVQQVFQIQRKGQQQRYFPFKNLPNKSKPSIINNSSFKNIFYSIVLLWHGSRHSNFVGILSEGLRIAPPQAPVTGYMFGKGLYFADVPSKSAAYCHAKMDNPEGMLVLCEVALGNIHTIQKAKAFKKPPQYFHSVKGEGRLIIDEEKRKKTEDSVSYYDGGRVLENESLKSRAVESDLMYNEYVVYDTAQVQMKFIVKVQFDFNLYT